MGNSRPYSYYYYNCSHFSLFPFADTAIVDGDYSIQSFYRESGAEDLPQGLDGAVYWGQIRTQAAVAAERYYAVPLDVVVIAGHTAWLH